MLIFEGVAVPGTIKTNRYWRNRFLTRVSLEGPGLPQPLSPLGHVRLVVFFPLQRVRQLHSCPCPWDTGTRQAE